MKLMYSQYPGAHERQLKRRFENAELFSLKSEDISQEQVLLARRKDTEEVQSYMQTFQTVVERAVNLKPNEQSDVILTLKEDLDKSYQQCCSLQGNMADIKKALQQLISVIMHAIRAAAGNDMEALQKLDEEEIARAEHFRLQELPLVADLMREDSSIHANELGITLISEDASQVNAALALFSHEQVSLIISNLKPFQIIINQNKHYSEMYQMLLDHLSDTASTDNIN